MIDRVSIKEIKNAMDRSCSYLHLNPKAIKKTLEFISKKENITEREAWDMFMFELLRGDLK